MSDTVMIVAGESSGELYGALLARELRARKPGLRIIGMGGQRMREAGVELFAPLTSAMGFTEVVMLLRKLKKTLDMTFEALKAERPRAVVLIDYPDFNFRVMRKAHALGIKVFYYVSPQLWAWRKGRIKSIQKYVDRMAVILPFEEEFYHNAGVRCEFVGHPVFEEMRAIPSDQAEVKRSLGLDADRRYVALLPGSRHNELSRLLPVYLDAVRIFHAKHPGIGILLSVAPNIDPERYRKYFDAFEAEGVLVRHDHAALLYSASDAAVVASGTAALQGVFRRTPLAVVYKASKISEIIVRTITNVKYVNLANIMLGREAVRELLQEAANPRGIAGELERLVYDTAYRARMLSDMDEVIGRFEGKRPSARAAEMVIEMAYGEAA